MQNRLFFDPKFAKKAPLVVILAYGAAVVILLLFLVEVILNFFGYEVTLVEFKY